MSAPKVQSKHTNAFFGVSMLFLGIAVVWNVINISLLQLSIHERYGLIMGILAAMFATVVVSKVVRDREESTEFVNGLRQAQYEEYLAKAPAPGLGQV